MLFFVSAWDLSYYVLALMKGMKTVFLRVIRRHHLCVAILPVLPHGCAAASFSLTCPPAHSMLRLLGFISLMRMLLAEIRGYMDDVENKNIYFNQVKYPEGYGEVSRRN